MNVRGITIWGLLAVANTAFADSFGEVEALYAQEQKSATIGSPINLSSAYGFNFAQRFGHSLATNGMFAIFVQGGVSFIKLNSPTGYALNSSMLTPYSGHLGIKFGGSRVSFALTAGVRNQYMIATVDSTTSTINLASVMSPEGELAIRWMPLKGSGHILGFQIHAGYQYQSLLNTTYDARIDMGITYGAQVILDFNPSDNPLSIVGYVNGARQRTTSGDQTTLQYGAGIRLSFGLSTKKKASGNQSAGL